jgi:PAS domain S-box-containing protein
MRLKTVYIFLYALLGLFSQTGKADTIINFTEEQKLWLQQHGPVTMCVDPDWEPFESIDENGKHVGIAADLLELISLRSGVTFRLVITENWEQSLEYSKQGKCQVLSFLNPTPQREEWLIFTDPYFSEHNVFITREEHDFISDPARLSNHSMVLPRGTSIEERIRNDYPNLELILVESESDAMKMVDKKKADMTMRSLSMAAYTIKKEGYFNLKIAGRLPRYSNQLSMGISSDLPLLKDILNPAIATITPQEIEQATHSHISVKIVSPPNYKVIMAVAAALMLILIVGLAWNYQLRRLNARLSEKQGRLIELSKKLKEDIEIRREIEEKLRDNEKQLTGIISNLPGFVYRCFNDEKYTMQYISKGCAEVTGYPAEDFLQKKRINFVEIIQPEDLDGISEKWAEALKKRKHFEHEYRISHKDGSIRWVWERGHGLFSDQGKLLYLEGFITDITSQKEAVQALRESEQKYRLITGNASDVIWILNVTKNRYTFISPSIKQLRGMSVEEAMNEDPAQSLTSESYKKVKNLIDRELNLLSQHPWQSTETVITEIRQPHKDGRIIWVEVSTRLQINPTGEVEVIGVSRNVEERKKMELAIKTRNQMQRLVAAISKEFITANKENINSKLDKTLQQAGEYFNLDRAYVFRYSEDKKYYQLTHEWCAEGIAPTYENDPEIAFSDYPWWNEQVQENEPIYIPDIELLPIEAALEKAEFKRQKVKSMVCFPVLIKGVVTGLFGFDAVKEKVSFSSEQLLAMQLISNSISDTLERINAEMALAKSEEASRGNAARYKAFIAASNAGAWEYNYGTGHLWCSPNYFTMLGRDSKDFDLQSPDNAITIWNELLHPDDREQVFAHLHNFMINLGETYENTFRMLDANGNDFWVLSRGKLLIDNTGKKPPVIIGTHMDINNQKKAEELIKTKNKELETFLYVTSHDLRSPLINVQGFSHKIEKQLLKLKAMAPAIQTQGEESDSLEQILNENIPRSLSLIYSNVDKMNNLIDGLLTISRVGRVKLNIAECKMDKLISHIHINLGIQIEQSNAQINASSLPDCFGDEDLLNQVFTNLIDNAIKYQKPDTPPEISITGRKEKSSVIYTITDNGIGISEDHLPRIWDVFFRTDTSSAQKGEGIGLSLVKVIVEKHQGKVRVESAEGKGSTFYVQLPATNFTE